MNDIRKILLKARFELWRAKNRIKGTKVWDDRGLTNKTRGRSVADAIHITQVDRYKRGRRDFLNLKCCSPRMAMDNESLSNN